LLFCSGLMCNSLLFR